MARPGDDEQGNGRQEVQQTYFLPGKTVANVIFRIQLSKSEFTYIHACLSNFAESSLSKWVGYATLRRYIHTYSRAAWAPEDRSAAVVWDVQERNACRVYNPDACDCMLLSHEMHCPLGRKAIDDLYRLTEVASQCDVVYHSV